MNERVMWAGVLLFSLTLFGLAAYFLVNEISKLTILIGLCRNNRKVMMFVSTMLLFILVIVLSITLSFTNAVVILIHLCLFTLLVKIIVFFIHKDLLNYVIVISLLITCIFFIHSYYNLYKVEKVTYNLQSDKLNNSYKVVMFSDSHIGTTFSGSGLDKYVEEINGTNPDVVVIVGDFIDDSTSLKDMKDASKALNNLKTKYGVYYVCGNHDKGYYASKRGYGYKELIDNLKENKVTVLEDKTVLINDELYLIGRIDKSYNFRKDIKELVKELDSNKYLLVLDHEPNDYQNEKDAKCDLVLSGHTHGGQMFPIGPIGELIGANDFTYGYKRIEDTEFIVSSGISDWELMFKSGCKSEFVIINIDPKN